MTDMSYTKCPHCGTAPRQTVEGPCQCPNCGLNYSLRLIRREFTLALLQGFVAGASVIFTEDADRYPHFIVPKGASGRVVRVASDCIYIRMDGVIEGLADSEWEGVFQYELDTAEDDAEQGSLPPFAVVDVVRASKDARVRVVRDEGLYDNTYIDNDEDWRIVERDGMWGYVAERWEGDRWEEVTSCDGYIGRVPDLDLDTAFNLAQGLEGSAS